MPLVIIENTPGYLPEELEPATFADDEIEEARIYLDTRVGEYLGDCPGYALANWTDDHEWAHVVTDQPHDLGRVFYIEAV